MDKDIRVWPDHPAKLMHGYQRRVYASQRVVPFNVLAWVLACANEGGRVDWDVCFFSAGDGFVHFCSLYSMMGYSYR